MTYKDAVKEFKLSLHDGDYDYWTVQEMWAAYTDSINPDNDRDYITMRLEEIA